MPYCLASSAIHLAQLFSISLCWFSHSLRDQLMNPHSSMLTATGLALACVHALFERLTYSPMVFGLSSAPACDETPAEELPKKLPSDSIVRAPSAVCNTISRTPEPPRLE